MQLDKFETNFFFFFFVNFQSTSRFFYGFYNLAQQEMRKSMNSTIQK